MSLSHHKIKIKIPKTMGLYIHLPWCVKKCPYCDFNSHQRPEKLDESTYIDTLIIDFKKTQQTHQIATIKSIFIGGGTPSLFSGESIDKLINHIAKYSDLASDAEITMEANPGASDQSRFKLYKQAGVNRLSIGVQSFNSTMLKKLGRIHDEKQAYLAIEAARTAGFNNLNLDIMYALPKQTPEQAYDDIIKAIEMSPEHISAYQLTIEPNTVFARYPPTLPSEKNLNHIEQNITTTLKENHYKRYEVSAYAKNAKYHAKHNLNYWNYGDYIGIGAGAHGKITKHDGVYRTVKNKHPDTYMKAMQLNPQQQITGYKVQHNELALEFLMNKLRLNDGFTRSQFEESTGLDFDQLTLGLQRAINEKLVTKQNNHYNLTDKGKLFLNDVLQLFL